jgi:hypothetical protein
MFVKLSRFIPLFFPDFPHRLALIYEFNKKPSEQILICASNYIQLNVSSSNKNRFYRVFHRRSAKPDNVYPSIYTNHHTGAAQRTKSTRAASVANTAPQLASDYESATYAANTS